MLTEQQLEEIIRDWSFWDTEPSPSVPPQVMLPIEWSADLVLILQGVLVKR